MVRQLQAIKMELRRRMHDPIAKTGAWMEQMLKGHLNYYAVSGNDPSLWWFVAEVRWRWLKTRQGSLLFTVVLSHRPGAALGRGALAPFACVLVCLIPS